MSRTVPSKANAAALLTLTAANAAAAPTSSDIDVSNYGGLNLYVNISAITGTTPTLTVTVQGKDDISGTYYTILASAALNATGLTVLKVYPGLTAAANTVANDVLPKTIRILTAIGGTTPAVTATISPVFI
jgi:hypothetical protein